MSGRFQPGVLGVPHDVLVLRSLGGAARAVAVVGLVLTLSACRHSDSGFPNGVIGVTNTFGTCAYNSAEHGVVFHFTLTGDKSADMVAEVHQARPGTRHPVDHPGPVIASKELKIRHGDYTNPLTIVVPLTKSKFKARRTRCILQTYNLGPDVIGPTRPS